MRSYLPADHPDKHREIGSEPTPAAYLDALLELTAEWRRILAPHGSICVELGDTYSGSGGSGGDYNADGLREGQEKFSGSASKRARLGVGDDYRPSRGGRDKAWPLAKSLCGVPTLYTWGLAYGRNLLTGEPSPAGQWRIRNVIVWGRPNPPVGALGDKFRPATSYITVACTGQKRWFDLDAVRMEPGPLGGSATPGLRKVTGARQDDGLPHMTNNHPAGAPPLDWCQEMPDEDGDWLWRLPTAPYPGAHYATYPEKLPLRLIEAMCPRQVCRQCGKARERITGETEYVPSATHRGGIAFADGERVAEGVNQWVGDGGARASVVRSAPTLGWTDCGHDNYRNGIVLDPFAGSGTTLAVAVGCGRDAVGIELDSRNVDLIRERCGMFLEVA